LRAGSHRKSLSGQRIQLGTANVDPRKQEDRHCRTCNDERRDRLEHTAQREVNELDRIGERIGQRSVTDQFGTGLAQFSKLGTAPMKRKTSETSRAYGGGEILDLPDIDRQEQPKRAKHRPHIIRAGSTSSQAIGANVT
jgi:hypothetical protein